MSLYYYFTYNYRYQVHRCKFSFENLPAGFRGLKIVQISDIHSGSFTDKHAVMRGVDKVLKEKPDLVLFTGDLINNMAEEMDNYMYVFNKVKSHMGVYFILV